MTAVAEPAVDYGDWDAAWCTRCEGLVSIEDCEEFTGSVLTHPGANDVRGCGPVVEAIWTGQYLVQVGTGEILAIEHRDGFRVTDQDSAEWVLERIFDAESDDVALEERKKLLVSNIERMQTAARRRAKWLRERFGPQLEEWSATELAGKKSRSIRTPFGTLSFRKSKRKLAVDDEMVAIAWCKEYGAEEAVKSTEKLLVSQLPAETVPAGCRVIPAEDAFKIECVPGAGKA